MKIDSKFQSELTENYQTELARILKAKRLEQGKSLMEVASGICSVSYLSRLENNQIKFQDPYLKMLFEKLAINYDELKKARKQNLFLSLIKKNLLHQTIAYKEMLNEMVKSNNYLDVERELVLLYDNLLENNFDEATFIMAKIDANNYYYSNMEKIFYIYLVVLFYYKTGQINMAYRHLKVLLSYKIDDEILYWVIFELAMEINFELGKNTIYIRDYMRFIKDAPANYFTNHFICHKFKMIYLESMDAFSQSVDKIKTYFSELNTSDENIKEAYYYCLGLIYLQANKYEMVLQLLSEVKLRPRIVKLLVIALMNVENATSYYHIIKMLNNYPFSKYDELIKNLYDYVMLKIGNANAFKMNSLLKNKIYNNLQSYFNQIAYQAIIKELLLFDVKNSKYKDGCHLMINYFNKLKNQIIDE